MDIITITTTIASLFLVVAIAEPLAAQLRLPYSVILACLGILIAVVAAFLLKTDLTDALNPVAQAVLELPIRSDTFLYIFLPTLLFQVTLGIDLRRMIDDWVPILVLAVVAVVVSTLLVGYALFWAGALALIPCLLIGSIVSTTDPSAVVSIFRSLSAPRRLARIIEGESLLNDAAAIALFSVFMGLVILGETKLVLSDALIQFPITIAAGAIVGWVIARVAVGIMARLPRYTLAQISLSISLPYLTMVVAQQGFGASGVIAIVVAGMTLNLQGPARLAPLAWTELREIWDLLAHWAGALIFILAALLIPRLLADISLNDVALIGVVVVAATVARALILFVLLPSLSAMRLSPPVERTYSVAIAWGGLRGAVTLALALAVTESVHAPDDIKRLVGILATGLVLFTLLIQGTTLRLVIKRLGLEELSPIDRALSEQVIAVALQSVREDLSRTIQPYEITHDIVRSEAKQFAESLDSVVKAAEKNTEVLDRDRVTLGLITLAGAERGTILAHFRDRAISFRLSRQILPEAERLLEAVRTDGRLGYRRASRESVRYGRLFRLAAYLHDHLIWSAPLRRMTADRFEILLSQRLSVRELSGFIDSRIRRIHGRRVAEVLHELLRRRLEMIEAALDGLRLQYPGYAEDLERRFIRRTSLRLEEREYDSLLSDGLIGIEVHTSLVRAVSLRRFEAEQRSRLDLTLRKSALIQLFPLFATLDEPTVQKLKSLLVTRYIDAGSLVCPDDGPLKSIYFVAAGAIEYRAAGQIRRVGRGSVFGKLTASTKSVRWVDIRAIVPTTLLELNESRFAKLAASSDALRRLVGEHTNTAP